MVPRMRRHSLERRGPGPGSRRSGYCWYPVHSTHHIHAFCNSVVPWAMGISHEFIFLLEGGGGIAHNLLKGFYMKTYHLTQCIIFKSWYSGKEILSHVASCLENYRPFPNFMYARSWQAKSFSNMASILYRTCHGQNEVKTISFVNQFF